MAKPARPLSPHISIYSWKFTMLLSILHRATGIALAAGALLLVYWLAAAASGPESFAAAQGLIGSWFGMLVLLGFSYALFFHLCNGIRHLFWDAGYGFELKDAYRSGWTVVVVAVIATVVSWVVGLRLV
ncbi:MAG TPA: succinate dehydrogenase, cytochrome b556 subunit [Alphaproteobacteria bacterium]